MTTERMQQTAEKCSAGDVSRELEAMQLHARLKAAGLMVLVVRGELIVAPSTRLSAEDGAAVERLRPELKALVEAGETGELVDAEPDIREWLETLNPIRREAFHTAARTHQKMFGSNLEQARRAAFDVQRLWK